MELNEEGYVSLESLLTEYKGEHEIWCGREYSVETGIERAVQQANDKSRYCQMKTASDYFRRKKEAALENAKETLKPFITVKQFSEEIGIDQRWVTNKINAAKQGLIKLVIEPNTGFKLAVIPPENLERVKQICSPSVSLESIRASANSTLDTSIKPKKPYRKGKAISLRSTNSSKKKALPSMPLLGIF